MKELKIVLLVLAVAYFVGAVIGPLPVSSIQEPFHFKAVCIFCAASFGTMFYAIHARLPIGWKIGWVVLFLGYAIFEVEAISGTLSNAPALTFSDFWLPSILVILIGSVVVWQLGRKWYRQRSYFHVPPEK